MAKAGSGAQTGPKRTRAKIKAIGSAMLHRFDCRMCVLEGLVQKLRLRQNSPDRVIV
jgi:hypothetical protein